jgi:hypothetical protein
MSVNTATGNAANPLWISRSAGCKECLRHLFAKAEKGSGNGPQMPEKPPNSLTPTMHLLCVSRFLTAAPEGIGPNTPKKTEQS